MSQPEPSKILPPRSTEVLDIDQTERNPLSRKNRLRKESWGLVLRRTWSDYFFEGLGDRGAALTYFTLMAFAPTILAVYSIATLLFANRKQEVEQLTQQLIQDYLPQNVSAQATDIVNTIIGSSAKGTIALVLSVLVSLFSASGYVRAFSRTANMVYGRVEGRGLLRTWAMMWVLTIFLVVGAVILVFANLLRDTVITGLIEPLAKPLHLESAVDFLLRIFLPVWNWLRFPVTVIVVLVLIAVLYHYAPNVRPPRFRWITLGSVLALLVNVVVWWLFGLYLQHFAGTSAYGALSTVMALFAALWVMNTVLIMGLKIDAEVLRAKELQIGLESQHYIQAAPRSDVAARAQAKTQQNLEARGDAILRHSAEDGGDAED